jgi:hypothetical protein
MATRTRIANNVIPAQLLKKIHTENQFSLTTVFRLSCHIRILCFFTVHSDIVIHSTATSLNRTLRLLFACVMRYIFMAEMTDPVPLIKAT